MKSSSSHVLLTERDLDFMTALHDHVVLSFAQVHEKYFAGRNAATAMNRLKRIENQGWIERIRVLRLRVQGRENATGVVFQLTPKGRAVLANHRPEMEIYEKCPVLNPHQLDHDLLVSDIADYFKKRFTNYNWINGRYLSDIGTLDKVPDAILKMHGSDKVIAIELELSGKSAKRYRDIVSIFRASRNIEKVIFVTAHTSIGRKIMSEIEGFSVPVGHQFRSDFFQFMRLSECLKDRRAIAITQNLGQMKGPA